MIDSPEVRSKMLAECRGILANKAEPRRPGPLEKKVSAVGFSDASFSGMAWTFHSQSRMFLRTVPFALQQHDSIFKAELQAMVAGQKELMEDMNENESYVWCGDNQAAIYVSRRGLTCVWNLNKMLRELFILKTSKKVGCVLVYVPSEENVADAASRVAQEIVVQAPACLLHPGKWCKEYESWLNSVSQVPLR